VYEVRPEYPTGDQYTLEPVRFGPVVAVEQLNGPGLILPSRPADLTPLGLPGLRKVDSGSRRLMVALP
jgi:hypothetical protein